MLMREKELWRCATITSSSSYNSCFLFITPKDCIELRPGIYKTDPMSTNAKLAEHFAFPVTRLLQYKTQLLLHHEKLLM